MTDESLPSGALKVAELLNEARIEGDSRYTLRTSAVAFAKGAEFALNIARRDLASPPPQATGALSEPVGEIVGTEKRGFALMTVVRWEPGFNRTKVGTLLYTAASQVEPEDK